MPVAEGVTLDDVARETSDMSRFVNFYQELFGFEETASFEIEGTKVKWLYLAGVYTMHVRERLNLNYQCPTTLHRPLLNSPIFQVLTISASLSPILISLSKLSRRRELRLSSREIR